MKPDIILTGKGHAGTQATLDAEFATHRLFDAQDKDKFLRELAPKVRALATFGHAPVNGALMDKLPKVEIIANFGVGVDAINLDDAKSRKIIVTNTPDVLNECVADTAIALVLNTLRKLPQSEAYARAGNWAAKGAYPLATSLGGKTLGILGSAASARRSQKRAMALRHEDPLPQPQTRRTCRTPTTRTPRRWRRTATW